MIYHQLALVGALLAPSIAMGQPAPADMPVMQRVQLAPGLIVLSLPDTGNGNVALFYGPDGTLLGDGGTKDIDAALVAAIAAAGAPPPRYIVNTHWHGDHSGGNKAFAERGALVLAHDNVREKLANAGDWYGTPYDAEPPAAHPALTWTDGITLRMNGEELRIFHPGAGHTAGDSILFWPNANVIQMGDTFNTVGTPFIDIRSGGGAKGLRTVLDHALSLSNGATRVIPGHGPIAAQSDLIDRRAMLDTAITAVEAGITAQRSLAAITADRPLAKWISADNEADMRRFLRDVYRSISGDMTAS